MSPRRLALPAALLALAASGCGGASARSPLRFDVRGRPHRGTSAQCAFAIRAAVAGGGTQTTCLRSVDGFPSPGAVTRARGTMTFATRRGSLRLKVTIVQLFGRDGVHARQTVHGTVVGGTGRFAGARGSVAGGGRVVDTATGLGPVRLAYRVDLSG